MENGSEKPSPKSTATAAKGELESADAPEAAQEAVVCKFASLLSTGSAGEQRRHSTVAATFTGVRPQAAVQGLVQCLSTSLEDHDVVCTLPSLDLHSDNDTREGSTPLPELGVMHVDGKPQNVPEMAASVLSPAAATQASANAAKLEQAAARRLGNITSWTKSSLVYAPSAVSNSISASFSTLVESRVRAWTLLLLRHSLTTGDDASRTRLLSMLSSSIEVKNATISFTTLPLPDLARGQPKEYDVILPLLFEAVVHVSIQDRTDNIPLRAPGTISGNFAKKDLLRSSSGQPGLTKLDVRLDTGALLESLVEQARLVVFKAVARATSAPGSTESPQTAGVGLERSAAAPPSLSGFSSALSLSSTPAAADEPARLQKARSSALRLNQVLQSGKTKSKSDRDDNGTTPLVKTRKNRSIKWNHLTELPSKDSANYPTAKRQRLVPSAPRIRSTKSFGRPHADDIRKNEPRNATFCEFGRPLRGDNIWGRDGKLRNHPTPGGASSLLLKDAGSTGSSSQNASFDLQPSRRSSPFGPTHDERQETDSNIPPGQAGAQGGLPQTAAALESWLMKSATNGNGNTS